MVGSRGEGVRGFVRQVENGVDVEEIKVGRVGI
jgi:hypothetical protein